MEISIILATYNERENILPLYNLISNNLDNKVNFEIIYVDDNSEDGTFEKIVNLSQSSTNIKYISRENKKGLSSAQIEGALIASGKYLLFMDSDLQHNPKYIINLLDKIKQTGSNVVSASRFLNSKDIELKDIRYKYSRLVIAAINYIFNIKNTDILTGYFIVNRELIFDNVDYLYRRGFKLLLDLVFNSKIKIIYCEIPFLFEKRSYGESKLNFKVIFEFIYLVLNQSLGKFIPARYLLFTISGCIGLLVQLFFILLLFKYLNYNFLFANFISIFLAMTVNFFINNFFTFFDKKINFRGYLKGLFKFYIFCALGIILNYSIFYFLYLNYNFILLSVLLGSIMGSIWNFIINSRFNWNDY